MPLRSSTSAETSFLDGKTAIAYLRRAAEKLLQEHEQVREVLLFGSLAQGNYAPGSDADLLMVLEQDDRSLLERIAEFLGAFLEAPLPVEMFPFTQAEMQRNHFAQSCFRQGVSLARRRGDSSSPNL